MGAWGQWRGGRRLGLAAALFGALAAGGSRAQEAPVGVLASGRIEMAGVSGAALLRDGTLLLVADDGNGAALLPDAAAHLRSGKVPAGQLRPLRESLKGQVELDDLEDAAWDGAGSAYLITSHGRTSRGDSPEERYRLARLRFDATGALLEARQSDAVLQAIVNGVPFLADSIRRTPARTGLNVEGLAWSPEGHLVLGLRSPTVTESTPRAHGGQEDAVVVRVKNPSRLFQSSAPPAELADVIKLDLRGQGIRGMAYDPQRKGYWLLSGLSAEPDHPVRSPWHLWFWDGTAAPREVSLPAGATLDEPEAVCLLPVEGKPALLLVADGKPESRYLLLPIPTPQP